ncbi:hypothetical protein HK102_009391 [Quaeritorhiza haematococci]|nr:hypothetical protein HK102_009391 [Quaeritorhiza haematococci]
MSYRKKVCEMLKFVGRHPELVEEIEAVEDSIQQWSVQDSELAIIEHDAKPVVYIGQVGPGIYKYGKTNRLERRLVEHKRNHIQDNNDFWLVFAVETPHNKLLEKVLETHVIAHDRKRTKKVNSTTETEMMELDEKFPLARVQQCLAEWAGLDQKQLEADLQAIRTAKATSLLHALGYCSTTDTTSIERELLIERFQSWTGIDDLKGAKGPINKILKELGVRIVSVDIQSKWAGKCVHHSKFKLTPLP